MLKNTNSLSDLINFEKQKKSFDNDVVEILKVIKKESGIELESKNIFIKNNNLKIKSSSGVRFVLLLHLDKIRRSLGTINKDFILEL